MAHPTRHRLAARSPQRPDQSRSRSAPRRTVPTPPSRELGQAAEHASGGTATPRLTWRTPVRESNPKAVYREPVGGFRLSSLRVVQCVTSSSRIVLRTS